ncbi:DUF2057 family protein [Vibrio ostreicida]|uniref:DUF2057 family protein n=1 Tax=Vibrio ostreicida TaxID=526588 RepID=UPI003B5C5066
MLKPLFVALLASAASFSALAVDIDLANGIGTEVLNGKTVKQETYNVIEGDNQFVFEFSGKLRDGHKRTYYSSRPYIVTLDLATAQTLEVELLSTKLNKIERWVDKKQPIFQFKIDGKVVEDHQELLPPAEGVFPYSNVPELVKTYNKERGLVFDSGKVVELKTELAKLEQTLPNASGAKASTIIAGVAETENTLKLKLWYLRASDEERKNFQRWMIDQN